MRSELLILGYPGVWPDPPGSRRMTRDLGIVLAAAKSHHRIAASTRLDKSAAREFTSSYIDSAIPYHGTRCRMTARGSVLAMLVLGWARPAMPLYRDPAHMNEAPMTTRSRARGHAAATSPQLLTAQKGMPC